MGEQLWKLHRVQERWLKFQYAIIATHRVNWGNVGHWGMSDKNVHDRLVVSQAMHAIYLQFIWHLAVHQLNQNVSYFHVSVADSICK